MLARSSPCVMPLAPMAEFAVSPLLVTVTPTVMVLSVTPRPFAVELVPALPLVDPLPPVEVPIPLDEPDGPDVPEVPDVPDVPLVPDDEPRDVPLPPPEVPPVEVPPLDGTT
jgi:hypothetical protein